MRNQAWHGVVGALCAGVALTACATIPTSGEVQITSTPGGVVGQAEPGVQVIPQPPQRNWSATEIVNGFIAASSSFDNRHAVAREFMTHRYARKWRPGWAATVIDTPSVAPVNGGSASGGHIQT